jgi:hypothetical protein
MFRKAINWEKSMLGTVASTSWPEDESWMTMCWACKFNTRKLEGGLANPTSVVAERGRRAVAGGREEEGSDLSYTIPQAS